MRVYVFGAGASQGSQPTGTGPERIVAPLMNQLFSAPYAEYAYDVTMTDKELRNLGMSIGATPVEDWLTSQWMAIESLPTPEAKQAARTRFGRLAFYVWRLFQAISATWDPNNLYLEFLEHAVTQSSFGMISFNYDTFLDHAVARVFESNLTSLNGYLKAKLIKPHGSINWIVRRRPDDPFIEPAREDSPDYRWRFMFASGQMFNGPPVADWNHLLVIPPGHRALESPPRVFGWALDHYFYPLIMLPLTSKMYDFAPQLPGFMIEKSKELLRQAEDLYIIGYRARDEIFATMLEAVREGTRLHVIGRDTAKDTFDYICALCPRLRTGRVHTGGFRGFVTEGLASR